MVKRLAYVAALLLAAVSCEIPFELDNISQPKLYVHYLPTDGTPRMKLGYAEPAFGKLSTKNYSFKASDISVQVNGKAASIKLLENTENDPGGNTVFVVPEVEGGLKAGDKVEVRIKGNNVPEAYAYTTIPPKPTVTSVEMKPVTRDSSDATKVTVYLSKAVEEGEYFGLKTAIKTTIVSGYMSEETYELLNSMGLGNLAAFTGLPGIPSMPDIPIQYDTTVMVSYTTAGQLASTADINKLDLDGFMSVDYRNGIVESGLFSGEPMMLLSERMFDGSAYSFYINSIDTFSGDMFDLDLGGIDDSYVVNTDEMPDFPDDPDYPGDGEDEPYYIYFIVSDKQEIQLEVFRLSEELYNYCKAQYLMNFNMLSNFGLSPPNFTYTNVSGGVGIVGGISSVKTIWYDVPRHPLI